MRILSRLADLILDELYEVIITYSGALSHRIDFPELSRVPAKRLREFTKATKNKNHFKAVKKLFDAIQQNTEYIKNEREKVMTFVLIHFNYHSKSTVVVRNSRAKKLSVV